MGNPRLFFILAFILLGGFFYIGIARYIDIMKKEESGYSNAQ